MVLSESQLNKHKFATFHNSLLQTCFRFNCKIDSQRTAFTLTKSFRTMSRKGHGNVKMPQWKFHNALIFLRLITVLSSATHTKKSHVRSWGGLGKKPKNVKNVKMSEEWPSHMSTHRWGYILKWQMFRPTFPTPTVDLVDQASDPPSQGNFSSLKFETPPPPPHPQENPVDQSSDPSSDP